MTTWSKMELKSLKHLCENFTVLYVEDDEQVASTFIEYLKKLFHDVIYRKDGEEGLIAYKESKPQLVITDIQMPKINGLQMSQKIKQINEEQIILVISAYSDSDKLVDFIKIGIDGYILKPVDYDQLNEMLYKTLHKLKKVQEHDIYEQALHQLVSEKTSENIILQYEKIENYEQTLYALIEIIESRDTYTGKHSLRVAQYSKKIGQAMNLEKEELDDLYKAAMLHDLGKIGIPDSLLLKPGKLNEQEFNLIKQHVNIGYHMLQQIPMFKNIAQMINGHHERYDGSGYPNGLKADSISLGASILGVADTFDAMTTNRIYKHRKSVTEALEEIKSLKNIHYNPKVVDAALGALKDMPIDESINQLPHTSLEEERFSFFYKDALCNVYNETYLDFVLAKNMYDPVYSTVNLICLHKFGEYNKSHGWSQGNDLLKEVATTLKMLYNDLMIFRVHGDDFIILNSKEKNFDADKLYELDKLLTNTPLHIQLTSYDIKKQKINSLSTLEMLI